MHAPAPTHHHWEPLPYMRRAVDFLAGHYSAGLPLKPGARKTSITLAAFEKLRAEGKARTMLVIAPLRVARQTWRQEAAKWSEFRHLSFALLHGDNKLKALKSGADVYLINPEGVAWLTKQYMGRPLPFDVVTIDELTKFMNSQAQRFKDLRPRLAGVKYRWGLTGSLFAKGHLNIFGQQLILDDGAALGKFFTHYRDKFFHADFNGFDYELLPGAETLILQKLAPYWFHMDDADYTQLPPLVDVPRIAVMDAPQRALYDKMKKDMLVDLGQNDVVTAANAGACYSKLSQMANGAVYREDRSVVRIHDLKLDMLEELVDELGGEPLLVAYEFNHDLDRIRERFGEVPYLGKGTTARQEDQWVRDWNARKIPLMLAHPQSAAHGLNMQGGQAYNVAWFSVPWDWEQYDQLIRRIRRDGNVSARIFNHLLIVRGTMDELKLEAVHNKDFTERRLVDGLNRQILRESQEQPGEDTMIAKLTRPGESQQAQQVQQRETQQGNQPAGGWGAPAGGAPADDQRQRIQETIAPQNRTTAAQAAFSGPVGEATDRIANNDYGATAGATQQQDGNGGGAAGWNQQAGATTAAAPDKPKRASRAKAAEETTVNVTDAIVAVDIAIMAARAQVLCAVIVSDDGTSTVEDLVDITRDLMEFVTRG